MDKYLLHGKLQAKPGLGDQLMQILLESAATMHLVKGCRLYIMSKDQTNADDIWITELWDSKEDHDNSLKLENVRETIGRAMPLIGGIPQKGQELTVKGGLGA